MIRPHPLMIDTFIKNGDMSAEEGQDYKDKIDTIDNIKLDTEKEYVATFWGSDVLFIDV